MTKLLKSVFAPATMLILALTLLMACQPDSPADAAQKDQIARQMDVKVRATQAVPAPVINTYQAREAVAKYMERVNNPGQVWYVYKESRSTGEILKGYTSSIHPMSVCSFMTPTEEVQEVDIMGGNDMAVVTSAISLDGLYYKGGECPTFFFDLLTDTLVVLDQDTVVSAYDRPLDTDVEIMAFKDVPLTPTPTAAPLATSVPLVSTISPESLTPIQDDQPSEVSPSNSAVTPPTRP